MEGTNHTATPARRIGLALGPLAFALAVLLPAPAAIPASAWLVAGLVLWMAAWWMTEAVPLSITALLPFVVLPLAGVASAEDTAADYYSPILFLLLGGAFIALAIERTGLHRRLSLAILRLVGKGGGPERLLLAFMISAALISMFISNTSTALIMMPMALAVLDGGAGLIEETLGVRISFVTWSLYAMPIVLLGVPLAAFIIARVQRLGEEDFDPVAARAAIGSGGAWSVAEKRLMVAVVLALLAWMTLPLTEPLLPRGGLTDGTIAAIAGLAMFLLPDGTGRPMLTWPEANRAPWDVVLMFGGGLALAMGITESGLAGWLGEALLPLSSVPPLLVALLLVGFVILVTEFASNIAAASAIMPVVAALVPALGADPILLALPAAIASTWGFMLPSGTGPNAIAWGSGHLSLRRMITAGLWLDIAGAFLIVGAVWGVAALI